MIVSTYFFQVSGQSYIPVYMCGWAQLDLMNSCVELANGISEYNKLVFIPFRMYI